MLEVENYFKQSKNITLSIPMDLNWLDEISLYKTIKDFDIGVAPMVDHEFNIAKILLDTIPTSQVLEPVRSSSLTAVPGSSSPFPDHWAGSYYF